MLNQDSYGRLDNLPEPTKGGPVYVECQKCKGKFTIEKRHRELHTNVAFMGRKKDGILTSATPQDVQYFRLCEVCYGKLQLWLGKK